MARARRGSACEGPGGRGQRRAPEKGSRAAADGTCPGARALPCGSAPAADGPAAPSADAHTRGLRLRPPPPRPTARPTPKGRLRLSARRTGGHGSPQGWVALGPLHAARGCDAATAGWGVLTARRMERAGTAEGRGQAQMPSSRPRPPRGRRKERHATKPGGGPTWGSHIKLPSAITRVHAPWAAQRSTPRPTGKVVEQAWGHGTRQ